jgi:Mn-dependent DtxR family transcriptional regulator
MKLCENNAALKEAEKFNATVDDRTRQILYALLTDESFLPELYDLIN